MGFGKVKMTLEQEFHADISIAIRDEWKKLGWPVPMWRPDEPGDDGGGPSIYFRKIGAEWSYDDDDAAFFNSHIKWQFPHLPDGALSHSNADVLQVVEEARKAVVDAAPAVS